MGPESGKDAWKGRVEAGLKVSSIESLYTSCLIKLTQFKNWNSKLPSIMLRLCISYFVPCLIFARTSIVLFSCMLKNDFLTQTDANRRNSK